MRPVHALKLLPIAQLAHHGPALHHPPRDGDKQRGRPAPRDQADADPRHDLKQVVGARDPAEAEAPWDAAGGGAAGAEVREHDVRVEVRELAGNEEGGAGGDDVGVAARGEGPGGDGVGGEDEVGDVEAGEEPVVGGVADDVEGGHGGGGELVHEDGLELALDEVHEQHPEGQGLDARERARRVRAEEGGGVDVGAQGVGEEEGEEEGPGVFDEVDGAPGDLGAWVGVG